MPVTGMGPIVTALDELPAVALDGVVFANELLDNLPFRIVERRDGAWWEVRVAVDGDALVESVVPAAASSRPRPTWWSADAPDGARVPVPDRAARSWLRACAVALRRGRLVVVDYAATGAELVERGADGWLRTYRDHDRGVAPLVAPGRAGHHRRRPARVPGARGGAGRVPPRARRDAGRVAAELGIDELVADARREWDARAHVGDLEALVTAAGSRGPHWRRRVVVTLRRLTSTPRVSAPTACLVFALRTPPGAIGADSARLVFSAGDGAEAARE